MKVTVDVNIKNARLALSVAGYFDAAKNLNDAELVDFLVEHLKHYGIYKINKNKEQLKDGDEL